VKLVAEYRRRALAVITLADHVGSDEEARELHKIARLWERLASIREKRLQTQQQHSPNEQS
jgi:purine-nucleoside phosphorylase